MPSKASKCSDYTHPIQEVKSNNSGSYAAIMILFAHLGRRFSYRILFWLRMVLFYRLGLCFIIFLFHHQVIAFQRQIAITVDDLPFVGLNHLNLIIEAAKEQAVPLTGFVIAGTITRPKDWTVLHQFREAGLSLGNHTLTHANLNKISADQFIHEIDEADKILAPVMSKPKYFRYPYLAVGHGSKKEKVLAYLSAKHYRVAPITIDSKDFMFNQLLMAVPEEQRRTFFEYLKACYFDFIWQQTLAAEKRNKLAKQPERTQILLIHANLLNAYALPDLIQFYRQHGFSFVSLDEALQTVKAPHLPKPQVVEEAPDAFLEWD